MLVKPTVDPVAKIIVIGVGGAGGNAVDTMISQYNIQGVEFITVNTDAQALHNSLANTTIQIGEETTGGLGAGGNPEKGKAAAEESIDTIQEHLAGADMVFIAAGMGGGTGTGAAPVIGKVSKELGALTVAVVTKPFTFEGKRRSDIAQQGLEEIKDSVDTLIVIPNQRLIDVVDRNLSFFEAMKKADEVLAQAVRSISSLVTQTGFMNVDFADVKAIMENAGTALMGIGSGSGENRAEQAAKQATKSPLLEMSIDGATGILMNVIGGNDMTLDEVNAVAEEVTRLADPSANIIFGTTLDEELQDELQVIVLATGFKEEPKSLTSTFDNSIMHNRLTQHSDTSANTEKAQEKTVRPTLPKTQPNNDLGMDDDELDTPAFLRKRK